VGKVGVVVDLEDLEDLVRVLLLVEASEDVRDDGRVGAALGGEGGK